MQGGQLLPHGAALCGCVGVLMWFSGSRQRLIASKLDEGSTEGRRRRCSHGRAAVRRRGRVIAPGGLVAGAAAAERGPPRRGVCTRPQGHGPEIFERGGGVQPAGPGWGGRTSRAW